MIVKWKRLRRIAKEISGKRTVIVASVGDKASRKMRGAISQTDNKITIYIKEKPPIVRDWIVKWSGDLPRIELFARQRTEGWTCIGNEISGKDIKQELEEIINAQRHISTQKTLFGT